MIENADSTIFTKSTIRNSPTVHKRNELQTVLENSKANFFVGTWNMGGCRELPNLEQFILHSCDRIRIDFYIIGTQESSIKKEKTLKAIQILLGYDFILVESYAFGVLRICLFVRKELTWYCHNVKTFGHATRPVSNVKTKGCVALYFQLFGSTFLFVNVHFTAKQDKYVARNTDYTNIYNACNTSHLGYDNWDNEIWLGDMNYRVDMPREMADSYIKKGDFYRLLQADQLTWEIFEHRLFPNYSEQPIKFPPTFKFNTGTTIYDTSHKARTPSWTDRIVFRSPDKSIKGLYYTSCPSITRSDHKPVLAIMQTTVLPYSTNRPRVKPAKFSLSLYRKKGFNTSTACEKNRDVDKNYRDNSMQYLETSTETDFSDSQVTPHLTKRKLILRKDSDSDSENNETFKPQTNDNPILNDTVLNNDDVIINNNTSNIKQSTASKLCVLQ